MNYNGATYIEVSILKAETYTVPPGYVPKPNIDAALYGLARVEGDIAIYVYMRSAK